MANLHGTPQAFHSNTDTVDTAAQINVGTRGVGDAGNEYVYLKGVASVGAGSWVVYDENYQTTLLTANEVGPVAIAMAAIVADRWGWFQIYGKNTIAKTDTVAADSTLYIDGTDGRADDAGVSGDIILGAYSMTADTANVATVFLNYPQVTNDIGGSGGSVGGSDTQVQFNDGGSLNGDAGFVYNKTTDALSVNGGFYPVTDDTGALGSATKQWADLFLASGALIKFASTDVVITHSAGILTVSTGDLRVTTAGTNAASVVTVGGTQTLTAKTLTSPTIGTSPTAAGATWTDLGTVTTADINGGTIDGAIIGGASAAAITGTVITANTSLMPDANDGAVLGAAATAFSDLFLASGAVIGFANSDVVVTHSAGILTVGTGDLRVTTAGTNTASVVTVGGTQTLTNKTLTAPTINAATLSGIVTLAESTSIDLDPAQGDQTWTGITRTGTAGATLAFGQLCYLAVADSRWELADADAIATAGHLLGMCVLAAGADGNATRMLLLGNIQAASQFPALTVGAPAYVGETAGAIQVAIPTGADNVIRVVGFALTADELYFNPSSDNQTTVA